MSIHFISGKPGGGKTLYSVRLIVDELVCGNRLIVTNVSIKLGELNKYLQDKYPAFYERQFISGLTHISDRIKLIDEDELQTFFTHRGKGVMLKSVSNGEWKSGIRPDYSIVKDEGVFYVLDEIHIAFNSRAWADTGAQVLYYLSQHRKLGDDVICITQSVGNVDKQFRSVAQDYTYIKNLSKQKAGLFRLPSLFVRNTYAQPATDTSQAMESGTFTLDVSGIAAIYDTARGVGIHGRTGADTNHRKKGLPWWTFFIAVGVGTWLLVHYCPNILAKLFTPAPHQIKHVPPPANHQTLPSPPTNDVPSLVVEKASAPVVIPEHDQPSETNMVYCTGYFIFEKQVTVYLSNGSTVDSDSGRINEIGKNYVIIDRVRLPVVKGVSSYKPVQNIQPAPYQARQTPPLDYYPQAPEQFIEYVPPSSITVSPAVGSSQPRQQISGLH